MKYYFYILRCKDNTFYCGSTNNPVKRSRRHNAGHGSVYVKIHGGGKIIYTEIFNTLKQAMRREAQVKKWSRKKKVDLISGKKF